MYTLKKLSTEQEFIAFTDIVANAYPGFNIKTQEEKRNLKENSMRTQEDNPIVNFYGIFKDEALYGSARFHDFNMNLLSEKIKVGGIGLVAVDLLHKKEKVAKTLITEFINHYINEGSSMVMLYPFRPDFYKKMGFGFGTSMNQYKIKPCNLPKEVSKANIAYAAEDDSTALLQCYTRLFRKTNGLVEKYERDFVAILKNPKLKVIVYKNENAIQGYASFEFKSGSEKSTLVNDIIVNDFVFENIEALYGMINFFNSQNDQIRHIIFNLQDEDFRFLLDDPRNDSNNLFAPVYHECSIQGTGIMYRIIDVLKLFNDLKNHNFNNETCKLKITIRDSFIEKNDDSYIINFTNGFALQSNDLDYDVEIVLDISDFSSLITCSVAFRSLLKYGKATISKSEYANTVNRIFSSDEKPVCLTIF